MPRFYAGDEEKYGGSGGGGFFGLKNDGDVARVRFLYNGIDDVEGYAVHEVEVDGKKRYVNCLREYNQPIDECPFCKDHKFQTVKLYIPIYNVDEDKVQVWERGKKFFAKLSSLCARYSDEKTPLVSQLFEIERNGKQGDTNTTYEVYPVGQPDSTTLEDLPELPKVLGGLILDKTYEEMEYYLENGEFESVEEEPVTKRSERVRETRDEGRVTRRTPATKRNERTRF